MDVGFIELTQGNLNAGLNSKGKMRDGTQITKNTDVALVDMSKDVKKFGAQTYSATQGTTKGKITTVGIKGNWSGYYFDNLFLTSCKNRSGDSGGALVVENDTIIGLTKGARSETPIVNGVYQETVGMPIVDIIKYEGIQPCK